MTNYSTHGMRHLEYTAPRPPNVAISCFYSCTTMHITMAESCYVVRIEGKGVGARVHNAKISITHYTIYIVGGLLNTGDL